MSKIKQNMQHIASDPGFRFLTRENQDNVLSFCRKEIPTIDRYMLKILSDPGFTQLSGNTIIIVRSLAKKMINMVNTAGIIGGSKAKKEDDLFGDFGSPDIMKSWGDRPPAKNLLDDVWEEEGHNKEEERKARQAYGVALSLFWTSGLDYRSWLQAAGIADIASMRKEYQRIEEKIMQDGSPIKRDGKWYAG